MEFGQVIPILENNDLTRKLINLSETVSWATPNTVTDCVIYTDGEDYEFEDIVQICLRNINNTTYLYVHYDKTDFVNRKRRAYMKFKLEDITDIFLN